MPTYALLVTVVIEAPSVHRAYSTIERVLQGADAHLIDAEVESTHPDEPNTDEGRDMTPPYEP